MIYIIGENGGAEADQPLQREKGETDIQLIEYFIDLWSFDFEKGFEYFEVDCYSLHVSVIVFGEYFFEEFDCYPKDFLFFKLHDDEEVDNKVHALAVADEGVPLGYAFEYVAEFFLIFL